VPAPPNRSERRIEMLEKITERTGYVLSPAEVEYIGGSSYKLALFLQHYGVDVVEYGDTYQYGGYTCDFPYARFRLQDDRVYQLNCTGLLFICSSKFTRWHGHFGTVNHPCRGVKSPQCDVLAHCSVCRNDTPRLLDRQNFIRRDMLSSVYGREHTLWI
jgi:hypothetical protein